MRQYISDIRALPDGSPVMGRFAVRGKEAVREYRAKEGRFFSLQLSDRTGSILMKYWGGRDPKTVMELYASIEPGDVVMLTGTVTMDQFEQAPVITVNEGTQLLRKVESVPQEELAEYLPSTKRDRGKMLEELLGIARSVKNEHLRALLESFFSDPVFVEKYSSSPSAIIHHHNYLGGNLEHSLNVLKLCLTLCDAYPELDRDLLIAGAILHDIGKLEEYATKATIVMTDRGRFLGHVAIGERMVSERAGAIPGFPEELMMKLGHLMLQHHGTLEENRLKGMKIPETAALHFADDADAQTKEFLQILEAARETKDAWSYQRAIGNEIYTK
ncbi:MAG: HD domain-containing protein [Thermoplasmata archaeon]